MPDSTVDHYGIETFPLRAPPEEDCREWYEPVEAGKELDSLLRRCGLLDHTGRSVLTLEIQSFTS